MKVKRIHLYISAMCLAAVVGVWYTDWEAFLRLPSPSLTGFALLLVVGILSESLAIRLTLAEGSASTSITFIPLLAGVQLFGPAAGVLLMALTGAFGEAVIRRKRAIRVIFNLAQWTFSTAAAGWVFTFWGGVALRGGSAADGVSLPSQLWPFVSYGLIFLALNHASVSMAITLSDGLPFRRVWDQALGRSGANLNDLLISPIALAVAFLYMKFDLSGILVVILPMLFIRHSYLTTARLREANRDLLKALVKAIETRDPYTSGHSLRVSFLAKRIAEELGVASAMANRIETAALLHDIGKIDAVYTELLLKPSALTPEERKIIESHVTKGEELIRNLSSFPDGVSLAVRHHHEREDGSGYPDGLRGEAIPLGARVINVSDAIDAMLSDRPYRQALSVATVLAELRINSGGQFNPEIVRTVVDSGILTEFVSLVSRRTLPEPSALNASWEPSFRAPSRLVAWRSKSRPVA